MPSSSRRSRLIGFAAVGGGVGSIIGLRGLTQAFSATCEGGSADVTTFTAASAGSPVLQNFLAGRATTSRSSQTLNAVTAATEASKESQGFLRPALAACTSLVVSLAVASASHLRTRRSRWLQMKKEEDTAVTRSASSADAAVQSLPPVWVVNLDKSVDRWSKCQVEFSANNVTAERFPATLGKAMTEAELQEHTTFGARYFCTAGMIGCFMSHLRIWQRIVKEDIPAVVVLEDDVVLYPDFNDKLKVLLADLPKDWDICLIGAVGCIGQDKEAFPMKLYELITGGGRPAPGKSRTLSDHIFVPYRPAGTHSYMVSRKGAEFLMKACPKARYHVDLTAWGLKDLKLYCARNFLATQRFDDDTTVSKTGAPLTMRFLTWCWEVSGFATMARKGGLPNLTWAWKTAVFALPVPFSSTRRRIIVECGPSSSFFVLLLLTCIPLWSLKPASFAFFYLGCICCMVRWLAGTLRAPPIACLWMISAGFFFAPALLG